MKSKKVLIVEDNDLNRKLFEILIGQFYSYKSAINGLEAIELVTNNHFDLILMDIQMPKMDGITTMKKILQQGLSQCPIIAVTAFAGESDRNSFLNMGFTDYITKPIRSKDFLEIISSYLTHHPKPESKSEEIAPVLLDETILLQLKKYNSPEIIQKVILDFIADTSALLEKIEIALAEKNEVDLMENLHILKGNSGTLGANSIYFLSRSAEELSKVKNWSELTFTLEKLKIEKLAFEQYTKAEIILKNE